MYNFKSNNNKDTCEYIKEYNDLYGSTLYIFLEDVKVGLN